MATADDRAAAVAYTAKASRFLVTAELHESEAGFEPVVASCAAISGILAASAILTMHRGARRNSPDHDAQVRDLRAAGYSREANALRSLLSVKNPAQYYPRRVQASEAARCLDAATTILTTARRMTQREE